MDPTLPPLPPPPIPIKPKSNVLSVIITIIFFLLLGVEGFLVYQNYQLKQQITHVQPTPIPLISPSPLTTAASTLDPTANWKTYQDTVHGFSIKYPSNWTVLPGGGANPWINIDSPDIGPKGSQDAHIGMSVGIQVFNAVKQIEDADLKQLVIDEGILKHVTANIVTEGFTTIQNHKIFKYEYEGNERSYLFHYWGMNIANDKTIISLLITDFKEDKSLNTQELATQILSTFQFTDQVPTDEQSVVRQFVDEYARTYVATDWQKLNTLLTTSAAADMTQNGTTLPATGSFSSYQIMSIYQSTNPVGYKATIRFFRNGQPVYNIPNSHNDPSIIIVKENGSWKSITWYLFQ